jgi:putative endonuclease
MKGVRNSSQKTGQHAEQQALGFLQNQGLQLLDQNYRCHQGEIDLIMRDSNIIVFVEVRTRSNSCYEDPIESVTIGKQKKIFKAATHYLQKMNWLDSVDCRFDIIGITDPNQVEWIKDAFEVDYF